MLSEQKQRFAKVADITDKAATDCQNSALEPAGEANQSRLAI
jgi:hypothetical protein